MGRTSINNKLFISRSDVEPIYCKHRRKIPGGEDYTLHLSNYWEIYILIEGEADRIVEDRCYYLEPYDVIVLNPYEPHTHRIKTLGQHYERLYFHIRADAFSFMKNDPLELLMKENEKGHNLICLPPEQKEELKGLLDVFKTEWDKQDRAVELEAYGSLMRILSLLNAHVVRQAEGKVASTPTHETLGDIPPVVFDVLRYIERHISYSFNEEDLAARFHISAPYLSRLFKRHIGKGLKQYMMICKIGHAKRLLEGGKSVTDTCFECAFNDCSYFIKVFKSYTGVTPYKYQISCKRAKGE